MCRITKSAFLLCLVALTVIVASCSSPQPDSSRTAEAPDQPAGEVASPDSVVESMEPSEPTGEVGVTEMAAEPQPDEAASPPDAADDPDADDPFAVMVDPLEADPPEAGEAGQIVRTPDVHFVPTPQEVVDRMIELAQVSKDDVVYDLGCGDGRIVVTAAKKHGCKAIGFDIDPKRVKESRENVSKNGVEDLVTIKNADIFELDLTPASVVTLYLLPQLNVRLIPQLKALKPGSRIVSHDFDMRGVEADKVENLTSSDGISHTIYFWTTPLKIDQAKVDELNELFSE
jgi:SAM-dependent methyltransferase